MVHADDVVVCNRNELPSCLHPPVEDGTVARSADDVVEDAGW